ncbi:hypothetical protein GIB67_023128, partial [Kingdonia uniflora]
MVVRTNAKIVRTTKAKKERNPRKTTIVQKVVRTKTFPWANTPGVMSLRSIDRSNENRGRANGQEFVGMDKDVVRTNKKSWAKFQEIGQLVRMTFGKFPIFLDPQDHPQQQAN